MFRSSFSDMMIKTIRRISFAISPNMLEDLGLIATLEWYCREFSILNGIPCQFESNFNEYALSTEIQLDFFRICQEALNNVIQHAQASLIKISIKEDETRIVLSIKDNGKGFDINYNQPSQGIIHMRERVASINGRLIIKTDIGKRIRIYVQIVKPKTKI